MKSTTVGGRPDVPVEAGSLADLNHLAANPPQYPVNPTEQRHQPLTLYISRVPGTRDIILSPVKPQLKTVTEVDVATSFYYIHLEQYQDLLPPGPIKDPHYNSPSSRESSRSRSQQQIPRKPLPPNPKVSPNVSLLRGPGASDQDVRPQTPQSDPGAVLGKVTSPTGSSDGPALPPRPPPGTPPGYDVIPDLPPRPASSYHSPPGSSPGGGPRLFGPRPQPPESRGEYERRRYQPPTEGISDVRPPADRQESRSGSPSKKLDNYTPFSPFTLTLIRRDPVSGRQWNVGKVTSHQIETEEESGYVHQRPAWEPGPAAPPINIFIETSGYCKFRGMPVRPSLDSRQRDSASSFPASLREASSPTEAGFTGFSRQAVMTYSKSLMTGIRNKFRRSGDTADDSNLGRTHGRTDSTTSVDSAEHITADAPITQPGPGLKPRGYMFVSPWDGRCEFRTGTAGRSVTCRHVLPESSQAHSNPLAPGSSPPDRLKAMAAGHPLVSELRFSLPSKEVFGHRDEEGQRHGHFGRLFKHHGDGDGDGEGWFDLRLGRERAGGGTSGKKAKMGKLIIYEEGLKMLDLVVSANMGIWWGAWERTF